MRWVPTGSRNIAASAVIGAVAAKPQTHPEGDDRGGPPPRPWTTSPLYEGSDLVGRKPDTTYTGAGLGRWLRG